MLTFVFISLIAVVSAQRHFGVSNLGGAALWNHVCAKMPSHELSAPFALYCTGEYVKYSPLIKFYSLSRPGIFRTLYNLDYMVFNGYVHPTGYHGCAAKSSTSVSLELLDFADNCNFVTSHDNSCNSFNFCPPKTFVSINSTFGNICVVVASQRLIGVYNPPDYLKILYGQRFVYCDLDKDRLFTLPLSAVQIYDPDFISGHLNRFDVDRDMVTLSFKFLPYFHKFFNHLTHAMDFSHKAVCNNSLIGVFGHVTVYSAEPSCLFSYEHGGNVYCGASSSKFCPEAHDVLLDYPVFSYRFLSRYPRQVSNVLLAVDDPSCNISVSNNVSVPSVTVINQVATDPNLTLINNFEPVLNFSCKNQRTRVVFEPEPTLNLTYIILDHFFYRLTGDSATFSQFIRSRRSITSWLAGVLETLIKPFFDVFIDVVSELLLQFVAFFLDFEPLLERILSTIEKGLELLVGFFYRLLVVVFKFLSSLLLMLDREILFLEFLILFMCIYYYFRDLIISFSVFAVFVLLIGFDRPYSSLLPILFEFIADLRSFSSSVLSHVTSTTSLNVNGSHASFSFVGTTIEIPYINRTNLTKNLLDSYFHFIDQNRFEL